MAGEGGGGARVKFIGRHLMMKGVYVDKLLEGAKTTTVRLGVFKPKYSEVIIHGHGRPVAKARIVKVEYKRVSELTDEDARRDGFQSVEEMIEALRRVYGDVKSDDVVTILHLDVVQRLDDLPPEDPYHGLEPADIARLALRYLRDELEEEDVKILEDLTRTNSIRMTTQRLYGSIGKRWRVRKTLRRVLRVLRARRLIGVRPSK
ncbi:ASCH domain-containing protein [Stetteria hydrogenophila]